MELVDCHIMDLYISAQNLQTLRYLGEFGKFKFQNIPSLVEASFGGIFCSFLQSDIGRVDFYEVLIGADQCSEIGIVHAVSGQ